MAEIKKIKIGNTEYTITDANAIHGTTNSVSVAGTKKNVTSVSPNTLYVGNGLIMGGTAAAAGLVTRGICGVTTPDSTGACTKENLYLNYDGDDNYSRKVVLGAGSVGNSIAGGATTFSAVRGDQMVNYVTSLGYTKNTGTVTSVAVKINGTVKGTITSSGTIDLGTYLTSHQPLTNYVTLNTAQTITGAKTFNAPKAANGEQATVTFKTANGGQIILGKEGPNSGSMIALDQVSGTRRLNFRASATPGAIVWSQPESNSSLYYDVTNVYFRECSSVSFNRASTITFNKFASASALGTDANGNLKKVSLAKVATSGSYNDLSNKPTILTTSDVNSLIADKFKKCVEITKFAYDGGTSTDPTDSYRTQILNNGSNIIFESAYKPTNDGNYDFDHQPKAYSAIHVMSDRIVLGAEDDHREGLSLVLTPNDITISDGQREFSVLDRSVVTSAVTSGNTNVLTSGGAYTALSKKQDNLVSGTNIKTINGNSLLGSGNLSITASLPSTTIVSDTNTTGYFSYDSSDWARWQLKAHDGTKQIKIYLTSIHIRGGNNSLTAVTFRDTWVKVPAVFVQEKTSPSVDIGSTYRNGLQVQDITKTGCNIRNNKGEAVYVNVMVIGW